MNAVRKPAVAGLFYPADPETLHGEVRALLHAVPAGGAAPTDKVTTASNAASRHTSPRRTFVSLSLVHSAGVVRGSGTAPAPTADPPVHRPPRRRP